MDFCPAIDDTETAPRIHAAVKCGELASASFKVLRWGGDHASRDEIISAFYRVGESTIPATIL